MQAPPDPWDVSWIPATTGSGATVKNPVNLKLSLPLGLTGPGLKTRYFGGEPDSAAATDSDKLKGKIKNTKRRRPFPRAASPAFVHSIVASQEITRLRIGELLEKMG
jgi:hypothetical protein